MLIIFDKIVIFIWRGNKKKLARGSQFWGKGGRGSRILVRESKGYGSDFKLCMVMNLD